MRLTTLRLTTLRRRVMLYRDRRRAAATLTGLVRGSEVAIVLLAAVLGGAVGVLAWLIGGAARLLHVALFDLPPGLDVSMAETEAMRLVLVPVAGGVVLAGANWVLKRWRPKQPVDPIEANALHGGRMTLPDAVVVGTQTLLSNGFGASVGLEAAYAQAAGGLASWLGRTFALRRADLRVLVGAGTAAAIAAVFDAPLSGAFYAFELVIGTYSIGALFPVVASAVAAVLVARALGHNAGAPEIISAGAVQYEHYPLALLTGVLAGLGAILLMRGVALAERMMAAAVPSVAQRLALGGLGVGLLALLSPVALAAGRGQLHHAFVTEVAAGTVLLLIGVKAAASIVSLGTGFRGGLFFGSLLLGALGGKLLAVAVAVLDPPGPDPLIMALVGMGAFGAAVIGAPLAVTFLVLETTSSLAVTALVLSAVVVAGLLVRRLFGYSFATWRFHLRGESIRSAHDVGWIRTLTVGRLMRRDVRKVRADTTPEAFRRQFPLGSVIKVAMLDDAGRYAGLLPVTEVHAAPPDTETVAGLAVQTGRVLLPAMNAREAMAAFEAAQADVLAVVDTIEDGNVIGLLTEAHVLRRYGEEVERRRREETGS